MRHSGVGEGEREKHISYKEKLYNREVALREHITKEEEAQSQSNNVKRSGGWGEDSRNILHENPYHDSRDLNRPRGR